LFLYKSTILENIKEQLKALLERSEWTEEDKRLLSAYLQQDSTEELKEMMQEHFNKEVHDPSGLDTSISERLLQNIHSKIAIEQKNNTAVIKLWTVRIAAACFLVGILTIGVYLFNRKPINKTGSTESIAGLQNNDAAPGGNKAVLTLSNGAQIVLDTAANGILIQQGNTKVLKLNDGQLAYQSTNSEQAEVLYNTITTPRGGQYKITLDDGTIVWLNAASSVRYPIFFTGKQRKVEISGEAYFEVAKNASMPFVVNAKGMEVEVLGTHFNVNSYSDEPSVKATLLEGSVKITTPAKSVIITPGQQAQLLQSGGIKILNNVDVEEVVAWKNGIFQFNNASLESVMRQLARWYDIDIEFEGNVPAVKLGGEISRNSNLSQVLQILNYSGVKFKIENKKIIVRNA
jgi:ferric-dicitrate binding protein FerR (iron transport regulator)